MSQNLIVEEFEELRGLDGKQKKKIKTLFIFNNRETSSPFRLMDKKNHIYITDVDDVFVFGPNSLRCLIEKDENVELGEDKSGCKEPDISKKGIFKFVHGAYHVFALCQNKDIYCWGLNSFGQLGNSNNFKFNGELSNEKLSGLILKDICCGDWHSLALTEGGKVYAWGDNQFGQIGDKNDKFPVRTPTLIKHALEEKKVTSISCGSMHSMVLTEENEVYSWGFNKYGQLGLGDNVNKNSPQLVPNLGKIKIKKICCGQKTSYCLTEDESIYVFGKIYTTKGKSYEKNPIKLTKSNMFSDIYSNISYDFTIALAGNVVYEFGKCKNGKKFEFSKTKHKSFDEYLKVEHGITFGTIKVNENDTEAVTEIDTESNV